MRHSLLLILLLGSVSLPQPLLVGMDSAPILDSIVPEIGATIRSANWVEITFNEPVRGVDASDLLRDGEPALRITGWGAGPYLFTFGPTANRVVQLDWSTDHAITDLASPANLFVGGSWAYRVDTDLAPARVIINEFLASNSGGLRDEDGDSPDWVELLNTGGDFVNLEDWALTDNPFILEKWRFPPLLLAPGEYLLVFASEKNRSLMDGSPIHTNFKLDVRGEYLALAAPREGGGALEAVSEFAPMFPGQRVNYSYGIADDGAHAYFRTPTPGAANGESFSGFVSDVNFSVESGFHDEAFTVEISTTTEGAEIRFTVDGSAPTAISGIRYSEPLAVSTTTVLRAAAFRSGFIPSRVETQTSIFLDDVRRQSGAGFPASWGAVPADYAVDPDVVNDPRYRDTFTGDLQSLPTLSIVMDTDDIFGTSGIYRHPTASGVAWERPASVELLHPDGERKGFQIDAGIRIMGGASREPGNTGKHSFRLLFKGIYGATKLEYPLFEDSPVTSFDTLALRGGYNYKWTHNSGTQRNRAQYARDQFARTTHLAMRQPASHGIYVHLYINGLYWGMYNFVERPDASFAAAHLGGDRDDYDSIKAGEPPEAISGDRVFWNEMMDLANAGLASAAAYYRILDYLDVENLIDYTILNHYIGNVDGPVCICGTNRPRNFYAARSRLPGSRYHFFAWDSEHSLAETSVDRTEIGINDADDTPARLYGRLRANEEFRVLFGDRVHRHLFNSGPLTPAAAAERLLGITALIERAVVGESARWGDYRRATPYTRDAEWRGEQRRLVNSYFPVRTGVLLAQYRRDGLYPDVEAPTFNQHGGRFTEGFRLAMTVPAGSIYFSLDGTDPRQPGGPIDPSALEFLAGASASLIGPGAVCRYLLPGIEEADIDWTAPDFDDATWEVGTTGVGFDRDTDFDDLIETDLESLMYGSRTTVYIRIPFEIEEPAALVSLTLRMKYDDGFVAYLNGHEVARANAPEELQWDSSAAATHADAGALVYESFNITDRLTLLESGANVLAIHGMNTSAVSSDLLLLPDLRGGSGEAAIPLDWNVTVKARAHVDGEWSALNEATFVLDAPMALRVTEIMYHPSAPPLDSPFESGDFEYIELQNVGALPLGLAGTRFTGGIRFDFSTGPAVLEPRELIVVASNLEAFSTRYDVAEIHLAGEFSGRLENAGESLRLVNPLDEVIQEFEFDDAWYPETDGAGYSLQIRDTSAELSTWSQKTSWRPGSLEHGTPGQEDPGLALHGWQRHGDINQDDEVNISDGVALLIALFVETPGSLPCDGASMSDGGNRVFFDMNGDSGVDIADPIHLLGYLFSGGPPPALGTECIPIEGCADRCR